MDPANRNASAPRLDTHIVRSTQDCLNEMENHHRQTGSPSNVIIILGRSGAGKSSLLEDLTSSKGHSDPSIDSEKVQIEKAVLGGSKYFIMDTPGFDPGNEKSTFIEVARGIQAVSRFARVIGMLYLTCINQPRFDEFDRKLVRFINALSGGTFSPRVTLVTTFWTAAGASQEATFNQRLASLCENWNIKAGTQAEGSYQHGRVYADDGKDTGDFLNWFECRDEIAQHAKDMIARRYGGQNAQTIHDCEPEIVRELNEGASLHATRAGEMLGVAPTSPTGTSSPEPHFNPGNNSNSTSGGGPEATAQSKARDWTAQNGSEEQSSFGSVLLEGALWFFRNVQVDYNFGSPGSSSRAPDISNSLDPNSVVDIFKAHGLDHTQDGRRKYASEHNITGVPLSSEWNNAIRRDFLQRYG